MRSYRSAFLIAVAVNAILLAVILLFWGPWRIGKSSIINSQSIPSTSQKPAQEASTPSTPLETPLSPVQLTPQRRQSIGVETGTVEYKAAENNIRITGNVDIDETKLAYVQLRFPGWIRRTFVDSTYQYVRKGQPLLTIYSPDLVTTENEYLLARQYERQTEHSSLPQVASGGQTLFQAARERLRQWEVPAREIAQLEETSKVREDLEIDSPVSGYVTERNALPNMYVEPSTRLYTVADLSTVWVYGQVFQTDIGQIHRGAPANVTVDTYPGRTFHGRVDFIYPQVVATTRTVRVRLVFGNPALALKPGMFVNVNFAIPVGQHLVIPASAVFHSGTRTIAFVDRGDGYLDPREIEIGTRAGEDVIVLKGLEGGQRVVTSANFLIDSESQLQAAMGSFAPPPPGAGAAAAMNRPNSQAATIDFTTSPSPPHKGSNVFRVKLTAVDGRPLTGATVTVTFFMPAMPAMGMAAMRTTATLQEKGGGFYEGSGSLQSGGTWQVTVQAQKSGQTVASKQLSMSAEGAM
jgi:Cu(I)/Ag(I) efflux system membrane fusion protein/cobalt-zinc-cadmium efflux system membrane fusion protein